MMMALRLWWSFLGMGWQLAIEAAILAAVAGAILWHDHKVDMGGYNRAMAEVKAAAYEQAATAQQEIAKIGDKYAEKRKILRADPDYLRPVSPLVGHAIDGLPAPSPRPK